MELNKSDPDVTTNIRLHLDLPEQSAMKLWRNMEESGYYFLPCNLIHVSDRTNRFKAIEVIAAGKAGEVEYWNTEDGKWESKRHVNQVKGLFHEASTTFMTEDFGAPQHGGTDPVSADIGRASVDKTYRPYGLENGNVYVTGAGLFPTAGSWNRKLHFSITVPAPRLI